THVANTANFLPVDEAAIVRDDVYMAVSSSAARRGAIWLMSTPRRQVGFFYNFWHQKNEWHKIYSTVADCPDIDPVFLQMQRLADETRYRQDFLCEFIQPANHL